ncbi:hypothetical protein [Neolewinella sp.]
MKKFKRLLPLLAATATLLLSSCNRGFGCPTNLSVQELVGSLFTWPW